MRAVAHGDGLRQHAPRLAVARPRMGSSPTCFGGVVVTEEDFDTIEAWYDGKARPLELGRTSPARALPAGTSSSPEVSGSAV